MAKFMSVKSCDRTSTLKIGRLLKLGSECFSGYPPLRGTITRRGMGLTGLCKDRYENNVLWWDDMSVRKFGTTV